MIRNLIFLLFVLPNFLIAQEIAPFEMDERVGASIDDKALQQLFAKEWVIYERRMYIKDSFTKHTGQYTFQINANGYFECSQSIHSKGTWEVIDSQLIHFKFPVGEDGFDRNVFSPGAYKLQALEEDKFILVKNLTSSYDNQLVYYFIDKESLPAKPKRRVIMAATSTSEDVSGYTKEQLISSIKAGYFMRNKPITVDLKAKTKQELLQIHKDINK